MMVPRGTISESYIAMYLMNELYGMFENISFYINSISVFPKPLETDLNAYLFSDFVSPSVLSVHTHESIESATLKGFE